MKNHLKSIIFPYIQTVLLINISMVGIGISLWLFGLYYEPETISQKVINYGSLALIFVFTLTYIIITVYGLFYIEKYLRKIFSRSKLLAFLRLLKKNSKLRINVLKASTIIDLIMILGICLGWYDTDETVLYNLFVAFQKYEFYSLGGCLAKYLIFYTLTFIQNKETQKHLYITIPGSILILVNLLLFAICFSIFLISLTQMITYIF